MPASTAYGTLYLVATPIGNLGDMTERALTTLRNVSHIAAEDTRRTRGLLSHFGITGKELHTLDANASERAVGRVVTLLKEGQDVAFATDAGTPGVSDPGRALVQAAVAAGVPIYSLPGASAVTTPSRFGLGGAFMFLFLPRQAAAQELLRRIDTRRFVVLFEAPHRIKNARDFRPLPEARCRRVRDLTKLPKRCAGRLKPAQKPARMLAKSWSCLGEAPRARPAE